MQTPQSPAFENSNNFLASTRGFKYEIIRLLIKSSRNTLKTIETLGKWQDVPLSKTNIIAKAR